MHVTGAATLDREPLLLRRPLPRRRWVGIAFAATAAAAVLAAWGIRAGTSRGDVAPVPLLAPAVTTVTPGVHLLGLTFPNAAYLVETSDGLVLVDTCPERDAAPILRQVRDLGLDVSKLRCILLTHAHGDHSLGAQKLRELTGAAVHAGRADCEVLRAGAPREALFSIFSMPHETHATDVDVELDGGEVVEVGGARFRVIATPGHTPGSLCFLLERDGLRILFTGDTVMSLTDSTPLTGPGIYPAYLSPRYRGSARATLSSLRTLLGLPMPDLVLPGHPAADPEPQSPRLTEERWESLLRTAISKVEILVERYEEDGADFLDGVAKELLPGLHYWGNHGGAAVYGLVTPTRELYLFDAPGGPGLPAFLDARWRKAGLEGMRPKAVLLTSCGIESTRGLASVVEEWGPTVVAPQDGLETVRALCPPGTAFLAAEALPTAGWFPAVVVPIRGLDAPGAAYVIRWKCETVVVSGREPTRTTLANGVVVHRSVPWSGAEPAAYLQSLDALRMLTPDLWLPAIPINGQNANLYDSDWAQVIRHNRAMLR